MAGLLKQATNLTGLEVCPNPRRILNKTYERISKLLQKMPEGCAYRKYTEEIIRQRSAIINSEQSIQVMEEKIGCGQIEEVITQAKNELKLAEKFLFMKPWLTLSTPIPKNQWEWPLKVKISNMKPHDPLTGVKCFTIAGRFLKARQRCLGMTEEERRWRAQFLKDQVLTEREPVYVNELYKETTNICRRILKLPMNKLENFLRPKMDPELAHNIRQFIGKMGILMFIYWIGHYVFTYHANDFTVWRCIRYMELDKRNFPDHPDYPIRPAKIPSDYFDQGFYSSVLCQDVPIPEPPPPPPPPAPPEGAICPPTGEEN